MDGVKELKLQPTLRPNWHWDLKEVIIHALEFAAAVSRSVTGLQDDTTEAMKDRKPTKVVRNALFL